MKKIKLFVAGFVGAALSLLPLASVQADSPCTVDQSNTTVQCCFETPTGSPACLGGHPKGPGETCDITVSLGPNGEYCFNYPVHT